jgi:hypothetical protein
MNVLLFRPIPKNDNFTVPFKLNTQSVSNWLSELSRYKARVACSFILQALQALNANDFTAKTRVSTLKTIHEYLKQYINQLDGSCWGASLPLSVKEEDYAEAVVWNYLALSEGFFIAAQDVGIKNEEIFALYMALYSLGQAQIHIAAIYKSPNQTFWQLTYKIFAWAEKHNLLKIQINNSDLKEITLNSLFAQLFIFQLCDTNQFSSHDMQTIFKFLPEVCGNFSIYKLSTIEFQTNVLNISYLQAIANHLGNFLENIAAQMSENQRLFVFDVNKNSAPLAFNQFDSFNESSLRYFTVTTVIESLESIINKGEKWHGVFKLINEELFSRVIKHLKAEQKRRDARIKVQNTLLGIIGFESVISFLYKASNKNNLRPHLAIAQKPSSYEELKLYAQKTQQGEINAGFKGAEFILPPVSDNTIWNNENEIDIVNQQVSIKKITLLDSSEHGYSVQGLDDNSKVKIGDIIAFISKDRKHLELTIIRRTLMIPNEGCNFGVEILGFESEVVIITLMDDKTRSGWAIFIPAIKSLNQSDSLIYQIGKFYVGDFIYIYRDNKKINAAIVKELNTTNLISHAELHYPFSA